jgi:hypothetical protein
MVELFQYLHEGSSREKTEEPRNDLVTIYATAQVDGERSAVHGRGSAWMLHSFVVAGHETHAATARAAGCRVIEHQSGVRRLRQNDPSLLPCPRGGGVVWFCAVTRRSSTSGARHEGNVEIRGKRVKKGRRARAALSVGEPRTRQI